ncbi:hypothetical protein H2O73_18625 [Vibrio sp. 404]|uniref:Uncharacterized protein n=1 Tax=Vibrio marinisediminis TaxID=2758441 RepID=A0A7W2FUE2_9VIBR|nr:hypothetical protein [Vibrio marinisediminis]MBA5764374.1 hypothetical protein [Vibrio marinisediminis]
MKSSAQNKQHTAGRTRISENAKRTFKRCGQYIVFIFFVSIFVNVCIRLDVIVLGSSLSETSVTEIAQIALLVITSACFYRLSQREVKLRHAAILMAGFFAVLTIREMDHWFDIVSHGFWFYPALAVTVAVLCYAYRGGVHTVNELATVLRLSHTKQLITWVILLLVFSRVYGMGGLWQQVMGEHYIREVKNISEEGIELLCYSFIAMSAVQIYSKFTMANREMAGDR